MALRELEDGEIEEGEIVDEVCSSPGIAPYLAYDAIACPTSVFHLMPPKRSAKQQHCMHCAA
jgi:hypothetical protein